jgi:phenylpyruvate tautomerase PptA (4-oxalocrotonate tautomerase family)
MPWINLTFRHGALSKEKQHALMADLTSALMFWEKVPDTPTARKSKQRITHKLIRSV